MSFELKPILLTTLKYEALSLPSKYIALHLIEKNFPITRRQEFSNAFLKDHKDDVIIAGLVTCLVAPFFEELIFRGVIPLGIQWLTKSKNLGVISSTIIFSVGHAWNNNNPITVISQLADCYFLYNPLKESRGLTASMLAHSIHNLIALTPTLKETFF